MKCAACQCENAPGIDHCQGCGAALPRGGDDLEAQVLSLLAQGQKIGAIKVYRQATGVGLAAAKDAVEALERGQRPPANAGAAAEGDIDDEIAALLARGEKIQAIRVYRNRTGVGLKEAKDAVDAFAAQRGVAVPGGSGCLGAIVVLAAVLGLLAIWPGRP
jgi:large subunit ribosomal protein L7/L12